MREKDRESYDTRRGNGAADRCCVTDVERLWNLKRKAYEMEMETSGPKDRWKSETDQDEKGETRRRIYYWSRLS